MHRELVFIAHPEGHFELDWVDDDSVVSKSQSLLQEHIFSKYNENKGLSLLYLGSSDKNVPLSSSLSWLRELCFLFIRGLSQIPEIGKVRQKATVVLEASDTERILQSLPFLVGSESVDSSWVEKLWEQLQSAYVNEVTHNEEPVEKILQGWGAHVHLAGRIFFHLVESKEENPFAFLVTYTADVTVSNRLKHLPLRNALLELGKNSKKLMELLGTVQLAAQKSKFVSEILESGEIFHPLYLSADEAYVVLKETSLYEECGILSRIPDWWKRKTTNVKVVVKVGEKGPSYMNAESLLSFDVSIALDGETVSVKELKMLLAQTEGLAHIKGKWIEIDREKLQATLDAYEKANKMVSAEGITFFEALKLQLSSEKRIDVGENSGLVEVKNGAWIDSFLDRMKSAPEKIEDKSIPGLRAELRPYQAIGMRWLRNLDSFGFGSCLADDMGLGKTVQVIAMLCAKRKEQKNLNSLLVVPASLISNWISELRKFAPEITFYIAHPSMGKAIPEKGKYDVVITTYGFVDRYEWVTEHEWSLVIIDEAQAIKNPGTKQTRAVKRLKAKSKIALTGTPVENRLSDLWSVFDFINPGLLGSAKEFTSLSKKMKESGGYGMLKKVISPFLLRRLKTDKSIIHDLPEKVEMKSYADLTKKQVVLYQSLVKELAVKIFQSKDDISRKGLILSSLMKFKQICNHPDQYLGSGSYPELESGKFARLREICETIKEKRERVLVFTQFKEMTSPLDDFLSCVFGHKGLVFHGEIPVKKRKGIVDKFQGDEYVPYLVLSLKAGGVGLNLTSANHVVHFDRWWNPAVENQATDRVFRIGQTRNVLVHKMISKGTIEEKIDLMIEDKRKLSNDLLPAAGETWITEMDNKQLIELFTLN